MSSADYQKDINRYKALKKQVNKIILNLKGSIGYVNTLGNTLRNSYSINDDDTPVETRTLTLRSNMSDTYKTLTGKIIPAIDAAIASTTKKYQKALSEERAAAQAKAAAEKKAKAAKAAKTKSYEERVKERVAKLPSYLSATERQKLIDKIKAEERKN